MWATVTNVDDLCRLHEVILNSVCLKVVCTMSSAAWTLLSKLAKAGLGLEHTVPFPCSKHTPEIAAGSRQRGLEEQAPPGQPQLQQHLQPDHQPWRLALRSVMFGRTRNGFSLFKEPHHL